MEQYIKKSDIVAKIERKINEVNLDTIEDWRNRIQREHDIEVMKCILSLFDTLEVKEVDLNNSIQLTWEDIRELYIIFAEVDAEIEFCKTDIQVETIGYYQEVLKRFKARKGE